MTGRLLPRVVAALVVAGVIGGITWKFFWDPKETFEPAANEAASMITADELAAAADTRVWFAHMSVGRNILGGVRWLYGETGAEAPNIVEVPVGEPADLPDGPVLAHTLIGDNGHPMRKLATFDSMVRSGIGDEVDVIGLKFCYLDVRWYSDVDEVFAAYRETMDALERDYPEVRFLHLTVPVTTGPYGIKDNIKVMIGRDDNAARARFNDLIRDTYPGDQLFDIALIEATRPDGTVTSELTGGYSDDGSHLNETGSALAAVGFLRALV